MSNPQRVGINTNVKQFNTSPINSALWLFTKSDNTITPGNKLANVVIQGNLTVTGTLNTPSDLTVKENIKIISEEESDKVLELQKIKFNYVYDNTKKQHYGLIAQEVEIFFPELVSEINYVNNENDKLLNMLIRLQECTNGTSRPVSTLSGMPYADYDTSSVIINNPNA